MSKKLALMMVLKYAIVPCASGPRSLKGAFVTVGSRMPPRRSELELNSTQPGAGLRLKGRVLPVAATRRAPLPVAGPVRMGVSRPGPSGSTRVRSFDGPKFDQDRATSITYYDYSMVKDLVTQIALKSESPCNHTLQASGTRGVKT
jgi:hypothetical protein